jgi:uncharacterized protein (DUF2236 family)
VRIFLRGEELTFGSTRVARQAARTINIQHRHINGELPQAAGRFPAGHRYDARDPELLLWVHATLVDSLLLSYQLFVGKLTETEQDQYYQESKAVAHLLGLLPTQMPQSLVDLQHYMYDMLHSDHLAATPQGHMLAQQTLFPPAHRALRPLMHLHLSVTNALLPPPIRDIYGYAWNDLQQRAFNISALSMRTIVPRLPLGLRILPITRKLMREETNPHM